MRSVLVFEFSMLTIEIKPDQRERQIKEMFARLKKKSSTFIQFHPFLSTKESALICFRSP